MSALARIPCHANLKDETMKIKWIIFSCVLFLLVLPAAVADSTSSSTTTSSSSSSTTSSTSTAIDQAALVYVSNVSLDSSSYFPGDDGVVTVTLTNGGTSAIGLSHPDLISCHIETIEDNSWEGMSFVGAGSTISYSLQFQVKPPTGTYSLLFTVGTQNGNAIHYPIPIDISSNDLTAAVTSKPTSFAPEAEQNVTLTLMNTRDGEIKNVVITPEGSGIDAVPSTELISSISGSSSEDVTFGITPHQASNLTFNISYQNGENTHYTDIVLPINIGQDKTAAVPVLNDVALTTSGSDYDITGDISNAGITDAKGVIVTVGSPATGTGTYPEYAIGSIASDDSGSFELTFATTDLSAVPIIISWKDADGNDFSVTKTLDLMSSAGSSLTASGSTTKSSTSTSDFSGGPGDMMGGGPGGMGPDGQGSTTTSFLTGSKGAGISSFYPVIGAAMLLVAGIVLYKKRKWIAERIRKQQ